MISNYRPFGSVLRSEGSTERTKFIGKEKDFESSLADHGVRKYDSDIGRFTSIDPLWEKYYSWTPYHYSANNPVMMRDVDGRDFGFAVNNPNDAMNFGHTTLYYQNGSGQWYQYDQGGAGNDDSYNNLPASSGVPSRDGSNNDSKAYVTIQEVSGPSKAAVLFETSSDEDQKISKSAQKSDKDHANGKKYNLFSNNCTDAAVDVINNSKTSIQIPNPGNIVAPNTWMNFLKNWKQKSDAKEVNEKASIGTSESGYSVKITDDNAIAK